jgi:hypothetical protein
MRPMHRNRLRRSCCTTTFVRTCGREHQIRLEWNHPRLRGRLENRRCLHHLGQRIRLCTRDRAERSEPIAHGTHDARGRHVLVTVHVVRQVYWAHGARWVRATVTSNRRRNNVRAQSGAKSESPRRVKQEGEGEAGAGSVRAMRASRYNARSESTTFGGCTASVRCRSDGWDARLGDAPWCTLEPTLAASAARGDAAACAPHRTWLRSTRGAAGWRSAPRRLRAAVSTDESHSSQRSNGRARRRRGGQRVRRTEG